LVGSASKINCNQEETFYMKGLFFPAQICNFSHPCPVAERIKVGLFRHGDYNKGIGGYRDFQKLQMGPKKVVLAFLIFSWAKKAKHIIQVWTKKFPSLCPFPSREAASGQPNSGTAF
jgi:hypothetical protein